MANELQQDQFVGDFDNISEIRQFDSGATRDTDKEKIKHEGFFNPLVIKRHAEYMHKHRKMKDGSLRDPDNWQGLFGEKHYDICADSLIRHVMDFWLHHRGYGYEAVEELEDSLCAMRFNIDAYLLKILLEKRAKDERKI